MADYSMKIDLNSSDYYAGINAAKAVTNEMTASMREFDAILKSSQGDLSAAAASLTQMMAAQRAAAAAAKDLAAAQVAEAKAEAATSREADRHAESLARQALNEARTGQATEQAHLATTRAATDYMRAEAQVTTQTQQRQLAQENATRSQERHSAAMDRAKQNELELQDNLSNTRYLLYDVGQTLELTSGFLLAFSSAATVAAASYQKDFAQVLRITGQASDEAAGLRNGLVKLTTDIPVNFADATGIAQLGAHLQLGNDGLVRFTETVAKFSAATGASSQETAQAFSRMQTMMNDAADSGTAYFNKLGSSIAQVGTVSKVSDAAVLSMVTGISSATATARMSTDATVGLASALASLAVQPEMARGALTRMFSAFNRDSADSTQKMDAFGKVLGTTGAAATQLWQTDPNKFFMDLVKGLHDAYANGQNLTIMFDRMGVKNVRDIQTLTRLAVGYDQLTTSMEQAKKGFTDGSALNELSRPVFETLAAKAEELGNAIKGFLDKIGSAGLAPLMFLVEGIKNMVVGLTDLQNAAPVLTWIINGFIALGATAGVLLGLKAAQTFVLAGLVSFQQMLGSSAAGAVNFRGILQQVAATMLTAKGATDELANSLVKGMGGFKAIGAAASMNAAQIQQYNAATTEAEIVQARAAVASNGFGGSLKSLGGMLVGLAGGLPGIITMVGIGLVGAFISASAAASEAGKNIAEAFKNGEKAGLAAIASEMNSKKMDLFGAADGNMADWDKSMTAVATRLGFSMDSIVAAVGRGKDGLASLKAQFDAVAQSKGFKDLTDAEGAARLGNGDAQSLLALKRALDAYATAHGQAAEDIKTTDAAVKKLTGAVNDDSDAMDGGETAVQKFDKAIQNLTKSVFSAVDAQSALGDASAKLGGSLQKSGSFGNDEGGRANMKNYEEVLTKAQQAYGEMAKAGQITGQQATEAYAKFVDDLDKKVAALGGHLGIAENLGKATIGEFSKIVSAYNASPGSTLKLKADGSKAVAGTAAAAGAATQVAAGAKPTVTVGANTAPAAAKTNQALVDIGSVVGIPHFFVLGAQTQPAETHAIEAQDWIRQLVKSPFSFFINANTDPAVQNVLNFLNWVNQQINALIPALGALQGLLPGGGPGDSAPTATAPTSHSTGPATEGLVTGPSAPSIAAFNPSDAIAGLGDLNNALGNVDDGYDKNADKAEKAGEAGKKAGKKAKEGWKDAEDGINEATAMADDYADRLKKGLDRAFTAQYGMQEATDAYYTQLNAINKARDDENTKVADLITKIKTLKDEQSKETVDANKAKMEQTISIKYGETSRAADYGQQAQQHADNAAAKQKEIDASQKELQTTQDGIGKLDGYTEAAIKNRAALRDLEQKHLDMVVAYAHTGASVEQVRQYAIGLDKQFAADVNQLGYNNAAVWNLIGSTDRYIGVINAVPYYKSTTLDANTDAATGKANALNGLLDGVARDRSSNLDVYTHVHGQIVNLAEINPANKIDGQDIWASEDDNGNILRKFMNRGGSVDGFADGGLIPGTPPSDPRQDNLMAQVDGRGQIKVRSKEFIQPQEAVDYYGVSFMEDVRRMRLPRFGAMSSPQMSAPSSMGSGMGGGVLSLSADSLAQLARMSDRPIYLFTSDEIIARSADRGSTVLATKGVS